MSTLTRQSNRQSPNQRARQAARRADGRYDEMNECEFCGVSLGDGYSSLSNCNETGIGLVCCEKCCAERERI